MLTHPISNPKPRRIKQLHISPDVLLDFFRYCDDKTRLLIEGLPQDARVVGVALDGGGWGNNTIRLLIESDSFQWVEQPHQTPELELRLARVYSEDAAQVL